MLRGLGLPLSCSLMLVGGLLIVTPANAASLQVGSTTKAKKLQFADIGDIQGWRKGGGNVVYIEDQTNKWYRVDMQGGCMNDDTSKGVRFLTEVDDVAGRHSVVDVGHYECRVRSITRGDGPSPS